MLNNSSGLTASDVLALTNSEGGFAGNGSWLWVIIVFALLFGFGGNGGGIFGRGGQTADGYVLSSDFATLQRQIDTATDSLQRQTTQIANGLSSLGYDQLAQMNGINQNISNCCCENRSAIADLNYNLATQICATNTNINQVAQQIMQNDNANYRALHDEIIANKMEAKDAQISAMNQQINALQLSASQSAQNQYLINQLRPAPVPSFPVPSPYYYGTGTTFA